MTVEGLAVTEDETMEMNYMDMLRVEEAIASVSLSHDDGCRCLTCRAARGDEDAFAEIYLDLHERAKAATAS